MIGTTIGNLKIVSKIGEGGMGIVYMAEHVTLPKRFAVKCLSPTLTRKSDFRERFFLEAQNQALLDHPNIVQVTDFLEKDDYFFLVMEYANGKELDDVISEKDRLSEEESLSIFKDALTGLNFAHSKGLVHRDIKPSNILVDDDGRVRIMDFGIAILAGDKRLTAAGVNIGSPWYMSPEQIRSPKNIDHRSDVYSMGIVLYEMLTGNVPFEGDTDYAIKNQHINADVPDPLEINPDISERLAKIITRALEKDPDDRYSGCGEFLQYIQAYEEEKEDVKKGGKLAWLLVIIGTISISIFALYYIGEEAKREEAIHTADKAKMEAEKKAKQAEIMAEKERIAKLEVAKKAREAEKKAEQAKLLAEKERNAKLEAAKKAMEAEKKAEQAEKERMAKERKSTYILIQSASEKASLLCRDIKEIPLKRENLEIAEDLGETALVDAYKKQIEDKEKNIREGLSVYGDFIKQLGNKQRSVVDLEFDKYSNVLTKKESFDQIKILRYVKRHYGAFLEENALDEAGYMDDFEKL